MDTDNVSGGGGARKRQRSRKCDSCTKEQKKSRKTEDPILYLRAKFLENMRKKKVPLPPLFGERTTFEAVYKRCDGRSVLSGESNHLLLTIASRKQLPETMDDLFLVTVEEAKRIAYQSDVARLETFRETMRLQGLL